MPFRRGTVAWARFRVIGGPTEAAPDLVEALAGHVLRPPSAGPPPETQAGWTAGRHVLDEDFDADAIRFGEQLLFALRVDTCRVPAELRRAYEQIAAGERSPGGLPPSRADRKAAKDDADARCREELAAGRHRRSKLVPVLWDVPRKTLLSPAFGDAAGNALAELFSATFDARLSRLTSGSMTSEILQRTGRTRDAEDLLPTAFTEPPEHAEEGMDAGGRPVVPWARGGPEPLDFVGNEFLLWLWCEAARGGAEIPLVAPSGVDGDAAPGGAGQHVVVALERSMDLECAWAATGALGVRTDAPARSAEARTGLRVGKWPRKIGLLVSSAGEGWSLTLQGDRMHASQVRLAEPAEKPKSEREAIELRLASIRALDRTLVRLFEAFLDRRTGSAWSSERERLAAWIRGDRRSSAPVVPRPAATVEVEVKTPDDEAAGDDAAEPVGVSTAQASS